MAGSAHRTAYRVFLRLYPAAFRKRYGSDMEELVARMIQRERERGGVWAVIRLWAGVVRDTLMRAAAERAAAFRRRLHGGHAPRSRFRESLGAILRDLSHAVRSLRRRPGFAMVAIGTLAVGIGANTSLFSVVYGVLLRPLPYHEPDRLVAIRSTKAEWEHSDVARFRFVWRRGFAVSYLDYEDWLEATTVFEGLGAYVAGQYTMVDGDRPEELSGIQVTAGVFESLRVLPMLGRLPSRAEDRIGALPVVVLSHGLWQRRFGADSAVVGHTVRLNDTPYTVIGVMPGEFYFPSPDVALWASLDDPYKQMSRGNGLLRVVARLAPGVSEERAYVQLDRIAGEIAAANSAQNGDGIRMSSYRLDVVGDVRLPLLVLTLAVGVVLLIACANVVNLLLVRATERRREIAVRSVLGATRGRIVRQTMSEAVVISVVGGGLGVAVAAVSLPALIRLLPSDLPRVGDILLDQSVLVFAVILSVVTGVLAGVLPAWSGTRAEIAPVLQGATRSMTGGRRRLRVQAGLVVSEIALAFVLLVGAAALIQAFARLRAVEIGFASERVLTLRLNLPAADYPTAERVEATYQQIITRVSATPGVESVGGVRELAFAHGSAFGPLEIETAGEARSVDLEHALVTSAFADAMAVPVRSGRFFTEEDRAGSVPVAVISETLAKAYWPDQSAIGQRVRRPSRRVTVPWVTIVGVVGDIRVGMQSNPQPRIYRPFSQTPARALSLILKTAVDPVSVVSAVQNAVWEIDPTLPVTQIVTMDELISRDVAQPRFQATLLGVLAALAGVLAVVGIYGVMAYSVTQRIPEFGVRMALGAEPSRIVRAVLRRSALLAAAGLAVGAGLVAVSSRVIAWLETGGPTRIGLFLDQGTFVNATDPLLVATAGVVLAAAALLAGAVPALRASKVDPLEALRRE